jgi:beta-phosphoglucomutase family hydrolase
MRKLKAFLFDLDGVITRTATLHGQAWKRLFDEFLKDPAHPFRLPEDYLDYVDGRPRYEGVQTFLASRGIELPLGHPGDAPGAGSICALGNRKDAFFADQMARHGVDVYSSTVEVLRALRAAHIRCACVSSSTHCRPILETAGLTGCFDQIYDGCDLEREGLPGKPRPDAFLRTAALLGVEPANAAVVEDAISGVEAGRAGAFGLVIGVDRGAGGEALERAGADLVVTDLSELDLPALLA